MFFLRLVPADVVDLPAERKQYGFDSVNFDYDVFAATSLVGRCLAKRSLPDYPITRNPAPASSSSTRTAPPHTFGKGKIRFRFLVNNDDGSTTYLYPFDD